jgi:hypothetical protein
MPNRFKQKIEKTCSVPSPFNFTSYAFQQVEGNIALQKKGLALEGLLDFDFNFKKIWTKS